MYPGRIQEIKDLWGPHKKYPYYFTDYPDVNLLLDAIPELILSVERNRQMSLDAINHSGEMVAELTALRAVADIANEFFKNMTTGQTNRHLAELNDALNAWREMKK